MEKWEKYSREQLTEILTSSSTFKEALKKLNYSTYSNNNKIIKKIAQKYDINISHYSHSTLKNLIGQRFGKLVVINRDENREKGHQKKVYWNCICDCGNIKSVQSQNLLSGKTQSCGCVQKQNTSSALKLDLLGKRFGKLVVIEPAESVLEQSGAKRTVWKCKCDCGNECYVKTINLRSGDTTSCGCIYSKGEQLIEEILKENNFLFKREYSFDDLLTEKGFKMRFDFAVFQNNEILALIEFQGIQHYEPWQDHKNSLSLEERQERDQIKQAYCAQKGYKLIIIPYWDYQKINIDYLKERFYK